MRRGKVCWYWLLSWFLCLCLATLFAHCLFSWLPVWKVRDLLSLSLSLSPSLSILGSFSHDWCVDECWFSYVFRMTFCCGGKRTAGPFCACHWFGNCLVSVFILQAQERYLERQSGQLIAQPLHREQFLAWPWHKINDDDWWSRQAAFIWSVHLCTIPPPSD